MGRQNNKTGRKKNKRPQTKKETQGNFVPDAGRGCYIVRTRKASPDWLIGWEDVDPQDYDGEQVPDVALDAEEQTLSLCNIDDYTKVAYVSIFETRVLGRNGLVLDPSETIDNQGQATQCVTFIVLCPPRVFCHLCFFDVTLEKDLSQIRIDSDVQRWSQHPNPNDEHPHSLTFPLEGGPFLCTQGENGELTHFFSGNLHAIDFRCPIGTPLLAVGSGEVVDAKDSNTLSGIAVSNLFEWNSILIKLDEIPCSPETVGRGPLFVEYVHIQKATVKAGDRVHQGQVIGASGNVGFSPEPHLHFSAFRSAEPTAPTVRVRFKASGEAESTSRNDSTFLPRAGCWYDSSGMVDNTAVTTGSRDK